MRVDQTDTTPRQAWLVVGLLFLCQVLNFFDKSVMGLAALPIMAEFGLDQKEYGLIASSFFSLYALSGVGVGFFLVNRVGPKWLIVALVVIWSLAQFPPVLTSSVWVLVASRITLGVGEGPGTPSCYNACYTWFPSDRRNLPTAVIMAGAGIGPLIGAPLLTSIIVAHGWRSAFLLCGGLGATWLLLWVLLGAEGPYATAAAARQPGSANEVSNTRFWTDPTIIGSFIAGFAAYWVAGFLVAWMAPYLQTGLGLAPHPAGIVLALISGTGSVALLVFSFISQRMLKSGASSRHARGTVNALCLLVGGIIVVASILVAAPVAKLILLALGFSLPLVTFAIGPAIVAEIAPAAKRGPALLIIYSAITISGFIGPAVSGVLIQNAGFDDALALTAAIVVTGGLAAWLLLNPEASARRFARPA